ncbi:MAG: hypothetical protein V4675_20565 [Verrucomicrobiota bacterium]
MKRPFKSSFAGAALLGWFFATIMMTCGGVIHAQTASETRQPWRYLLLNDSYLVDDCPVCGRPSIREPLRGAFELRLTEINPLFSRYAIVNLNLTAGSVRSYTLKGNGTFQIGGEVALVQQMELELEINDGASTRVCHLKNPSPAVTGRWPMINLTLEQTDGTLTQTYTLHLAAAPLREIWFSTALGFTAGLGEPGPVSGGDFLSSAGRVVHRSFQFCGALSPMPPCPDLGLDATDLLPGGEIAFSITQDIFSERLGPLRQGDVLSSRGRILHRQEELLAAFAPATPAVDAGLDALHMPDTGEVWFSIGSEVVSKTLKVTLHRGDLLSSTGEVVRSYQQLLSRFHPPAGSGDYGLDALYVWPGGEIWFSTEKGFQDQVLGPVQGGDLLSDQGYIVFRNLELLNTFAPLEDVAEFGLDALYIVTDATTPPQAPRLEITARPSTGSISLEWEGNGRVFQVERSDDPVTPFGPVSPILPALAFEDSGVMNSRSRAFYRLRQW